MNAALATQCQRLERRTPTTVQRLIEKPSGTPVEDLDTPVLIVDLNRLDANFATAGTATSACVTALSRRSSQQLRGVACTDASIGRYAGQV